MLFENLINSEGEKMNKVDTLKEVKKIIVNCKTETDHVWKQTSDWKVDSYIQYGDMYGHPEDRIGMRITCETATFECQNCGMQKTLRR